MAKKAIIAKDIMAIKKGSVGKKIVGAVVVVSTVYTAITAVRKVAQKKKEESNDFEQYQDIPVYNELFNGKSIRIDNEPFHGAIIKNVCSGIKLDLGNAIIDEDVDIRCENIMSGLDITVPEKVNVEIKSKTIMSGIMNNVPISEDETIPTIYIYAKGLMSGINVRVKNAQDCDDTCKCSEDTEEACQKCENESGNVTEEKENHSENETIKKDNDLKNDTKEKDNISEDSLKEYIDTEDFDKDASISFEEVDVEEIVNENNIETKK